MESGKTKKGSVTPNETSDLERLDIVPVRLLAAVRCRQRDWKHTAGTVLTVWVPCIGN